MENHIEDNGQKLFRDSVIATKSAMQSIPDAVRGEMSDKLREISKKLATDYKKLISAEMCEENEFAREIVRSIVEAANEAFYKVKFGSLERLEAGGEAPKADESAESRCKTDGVAQEQTPSERVES